MIAEVTDLQDSIVPNLVTLLIVGTSVRCLGLSPEAQKPETCHLEDLKRPG